MWLKEKGHKKTNNMIDKALHRKRKIKKNEPQ